MGEGGGQGGYTTNTMAFGAPNGTPEKIPRGILHSCKNFKTV